MYVSIHKLLFVLLQACLKGVPNGCSTGPGTTVKTLEARPQDQGPPIVIATASNVVDISWKPPLFPNGVISQYLVYYRKYGTVIELLINRVRGDTLIMRHAGLCLLQNFLY